MPKQIFFLALLLVSELLFIPQSLRLLPTTFPHSRLLRLLHYILIPLLTTPPYLFLHLSHSTPSTLTPLNHSTAMRIYPYDHTIFYPPNNSNSNSAFSAPPCRTCHLPKPARSKHCSICKSCIQKADHHCIWINNCVGRNNYGYFLGLMLSISILLAYGAYLGYQILDTQIQIQVQHRQSSPPTTTNTNSMNGINTNSIPTHRSTPLPQPSYTQRWSAMIPQHPLLAAPTLLSLLSFPLAAGLTAYHIYLIWAGMTTNESGKWADLREDIGEGRVWRARLEELKGDFSPERWGEGRQRGREGEGGDWPLEPGWVVVRMEEGGRRPRVRRRGDVRAREGDPEQWEEDERWMQVRSLSQIENIYDLGFWDNLKDVLLNRE